MCLFPKSNFNSFTIPTVQNISPHALAVIVSMIMQLQKCMNAESCWYLIIVALLGPFENFPYTPAISGEAEGVVTNLTCAYDYNCPVDIVDETSCMNFGGNAVVTCIFCKDI